MMDGLPNTESMMTTLKGGGEEEACRWGWASGVCRAGGSAYCTSSSSKFSSAAYFRGRPRCMWRPRLNSSSSTVQKDPNSSSTLTKHLCRERLVRMAPWESKPAGGGGAGAARCRCSDRRDRDRGRTHTETQGGGQRVRTKMKEKKKKPLWVMKHHQKHGGEANTKASRDLGRNGTQTTRWSSNSLFPSVNGDTGLKRPNLPTDLLRPSLLELYFVDCPHSPFYVFYPHKTLVKTKIMPDCVLQLV